MLCKSLWYVDIQVELSGSFSMLSVLVVVTALQTTAILIVMAAVIFLLCKYSSRKPAATQEAIAGKSSGVDDEMYEIMDHQVQKSSAQHKKNNPYAK